MIVHVIACTAMLLICSSCGPKPVGKLSRPAIYDAWDARYAYDMEERRMVPLYQGREVGRSWGRDSQGRLAQSSYTGASPEGNENLFALHQSRMNRMRNRYWDEGKAMRTESVKQMFANIEEEENDSLIEIVLEDEEDDFIPAPSFIPVGIEFGNDSAVDIEGEEEVSNGELMDLPFAPLP
jgi:hypothetical protein